MLVSIIIVNYNTNRLTAACIESVLRYAEPGTFEIIVVDNLSQKENPDVLAEQYPQIKLIKSPENGGFAKGNNLGISHSRGDVILLLNSDAYLTENGVNGPADYLRQHHEVSALSIRLHYEDGRYQHNARKFRSIRNELLDVFRPVLWLMPYRKKAVLMLNQHFKGDFSTPCDWVSGAFFMFRRALLEPLPGQKLDERYFMYGEDQLWCLQWEKLGYKAYFYSEAQAVHIVNASSGYHKMTALTKQMISRELDLMKLRKGQGLYYRLFALLLSSKEYLRMLLKLAYLKLTGKRIH